MTKRLKRGAATAGLQLTVILAAIFLWWLVTAVLPDPDSMARQFTPGETFSALGRMLGDGSLISGAGTSLLRLGGGLAIAFAVGVPVGLLIGGVPTADRASTALFQLLRMTSPLAWAPIAVLLFGVGGKPVVALVAIAAVWPIIIGTAAGVRGVDRDWLITARSLGARRLELLRTIVLPAVRPHVLTSLRLSLGVAWIVLVPAEMLGVLSGLGYEILNARDQIAYDRLMAVIVAIGVLGYLLDQAAQAALRPRRRRGRDAMRLAEAHEDEVLPVAG